jgi:hypothetical protein
MRRFPVGVRLALTGVLLLVVVVVAMLAVRQFTMPPTRAVNPGMIMTMDPRIVSNLTQMPMATALAGQEANEFVVFAGSVDRLRCERARRLAQSHVVRDAGTLAAG